MTNGRGKSDNCIVPAKSANAPKDRGSTDHGGPYTGTKAETPETAKGSPNVVDARVATGGESMEGRRLAKGNTAKQNTPRTQCRKHDVQNALDRVRQAAKRNRNAKFTALYHHLTVDLLRASFLKLKRKAAAGVDGVTWEQYAQDLEPNLLDLHARLHRGAYRAKPSRRTYIPKADGRQRPLGIAALEDKIVQRAAVEVLNAVYETDFLGFSYGFRPGRHQHQALDALTVGILRNKVNWVLDTDIRGFFDAIDHGWLMQFVEHRIGDKRLLRLIRKWLNAGVMENERWEACKEGSPQGATISPLLANIYLHYVFDVWVQWWRRQPGRGNVIVVRFADDIVLGFQHRRDAVVFDRELEQRMAKFGLVLHPDKTRLIEFGSYAQERRARRGQGRPETFDFLGFTHICGRARSGSFLLIRHTRADRMRVKLRHVRQELMRRRHLSIKKQGTWLGRVVRGYLNYHAIPTNTRACQQFRKQVTRHWYKALRRRSQRDRTRWARMSPLADRWLPKALVQHPWPTQRFDARTRGGSPVQ